MNKLNKKGFTLIEMLVVIAIIAVLVAIIIPTISSATTKASAAANAANLRSWKAELTTAYLSGDITAEDNKAPALNTPSSLKKVPEAPEAKEMKGLTETAAAAIWNGNEYVVTYGGFDIDDFATVAEKGTDLAKVGANAT